MKWDNTLKLQTQFIISELTTEKRYFEMLETVPPIAMVKNAFLVGEAADHDKQGRPRFDLYYTDNDKFYHAGLATLQDFKLWLIPA